VCRHAVHWCILDLDTSSINNQHHDLEICDGSYIFNDDLAIEWTIHTVTDFLCLVIFYLSEIRSSVSSIPTSMSLSVSKIYSFCDMASPVTKSRTCYNLLRMISPRGPRVYISIIWMDKSHSWSMSLNYHFQNTQCQLYNHPITVLRFMSSKYSSGVSDWHNPMV
jgi:hypothetical protein